MSKLPQGEEGATVWEFSRGDYRLRCLHEEKPYSIHTLIVQENGHELESHVLQDDPADCIASYQRRSKLEKALREKYYAYFERKMSSHRDDDASAVATSVSRG